MKETLYSEASVCDGSTVKPREYFLVVIQYLMVVAIGVYILAQTIMQSPNQVDIPHNVPTYVYFIYAYMTVDTFISILVMDRRQRGK